MQAVMLQLMPILAQAASPDTPDLPIARLITVLVASIALLLVLILILRVQAFVSLLISALFVAIASGMEWTTIGDVLVKGMGGSLGLLATVVGLGSIFGQVLEHSGGAQSLATTTYRVFGEKRSPFAMIFVGFLVSVPVFFDVGLVILAPILVALARSSGKSILYYGLPLCAGMAVTHACIPPTPGPILVGQNLGVDLGQMILWGSIIALPTAMISGIVGARMGLKMHIAPPDIFAPVDLKPGAKEVPAWEVIALILIPIALILASTIVKENIVSSSVPSVTEIMEDPTYVAQIEANGNAVNVETAGAVRNGLISDALVASGPAAKLILLLGHPISALLITTIATLFLLGTLRGTDKDTLMELSNKALGPAGIIILVTGAGGVFKTVLVESQVGEAVAAALSNGQISLMLLAFILTVIIRVAQGSATVAMIGGSAIMAPLVNQVGLEAPDRALMGVVIACGATMCSHVNDSGFWVVKNYLGMTEKQCLSTWTVITCIISVVGFALAWILSMFV